MLRTVISKMPWAGLVVVSCSAAILDREDSYLLTVITVSAKSNLRSGLRSTHPVAPLQTYSSPALSRRYSAPATGRQPAGPGPQALVGRAQGLPTGWLACHVQ